MTERLFIEGCLSDASSDGNCMYREWNEWNDLCVDECQLPGKRAILTDVIEVTSTEIKTIDEGVARG